MKGKVKPFFDIHIQTLKNTELNGNAGSWKMNV